MSIGTIRDDAQAKDLMRQIVFYDLPALREQWGEADVAENGWYPFRLIGLSVRHAQFQLPKGWRMRDTPIGIEVHFTP